MKYMFFDTAINGYHTLTFLKEQFPTWLPLMPEEEKILDDIAPFIFEVDDVKFSSLLQNSNVSLKKIVLIESKETITAIRNYYKQFAIQNIKGRDFYFRFWEAGVFKKFIKTCNPKQLKEFFGQVNRFSCQDDDLAFTLQFSFDGTSLITHRINEGTLSSMSKEGKAEDVLPQKINENAQDAGKQEKKSPRRFIY